MKSNISHLHLPHPSTPPTPHPRHTHATPTPHPCHTPHTPHLYTQHPQTHLPNLTHTPPTPPHPNPHVCLFPHLHIIPLNSPTSPHLPHLPHPDPHVPHPTSPSPPMHPTHPTPIHPPTHLCTSQMNFHFSSRAGFGLTNLLLELIYLSLAQVRFWPPFRTPFRPFQTSLSELDGLFILFRIV